MKKIKVQLLTNKDFDRDCKTFEKNMGRAPTDMEKRERKYDYECRNIDRLRDAIFEYDHETLEGYTVEAHSFTRDIDERLRGYAGATIDDFNTRLIEIVEDWKGVKITSPQPVEVDIDTLTDPNTDTCSIHYTIGDYDWYIMSAEKTPSGDYYCFGLVKFLDTELGYFMLNEIIMNGAVRDTDFTPCKIEEL